jgi:hypothetical protein
VRLPKSIISSSTLRFNFARLDLKLHCACVGLENGILSVEVIKF